MDQQPQDLLAELDRRIAITAPAPSGALPKPDLTRAGEALTRMLKANPDTGMEVPQSDASIGAGRDVLRSIFGPANPPAPGRQPRFQVDDDKIAGDVLQAWQTHPDLVESVDWRSQGIPDQGVRAYLEPKTGFFGSGRPRVTVSPEFKHQIDNVWHELSHQVGLEDFKSAPGQITAHDVTEASRRANRPRDINLPREGARSALPQPRINPQDVQRTIQAFDAEKDPTRKAQLAVQLQAFRQRLAGQ